ncbi:DUF7365 family protein [Mammaliicoccus sciuri]|uniref:DUF7365 family protein n=1 Tax=Mammaliicoccus sciuri TaxID=1296 RepID=UPI001C4F3305|nr:hypothetical protein [Mammaliicoccus sciuri]
MEEAILKWVITVGLPIIVFFMNAVSKTKDNEKRLTKMESDLKYANEKIKEQSSRLIIVENNYAVLIRVEEQLKTLFKQNEEIKEDIKSVKNNKL